MMVKFSKSICLGIALLCLTNVPVKASSTDYVIDFNMRDTFALPTDQHAGLPRFNYFNRTFDAPVEPRFKKITFVEKYDTDFLPERVEQLLHGVETVIPPEYDYYGYEIRRYMKSILTPHELGDSIKLTEEMNNVRRARIIMDYWSKKLNRDIHKLRREIEDGRATSRVRTAFRYNETKVTGFIPDMYAWIDRNIDFMEFVQEHRGRIFIRYPLYQVPEYEVRMEFKRLYDAREEARKKIIEYPPFRMMIY